MPKIPSETEMFFVCTALTYKAENFYFGRNLDYEHGFGEEVIVMPRNYDVKMSSLKPLGAKYAVLGMGCVAADFPLFFDAVNETGLCAAGLRFADNAFFKNKESEKENVAQYEFVPWLLARCANVGEAKEKIFNMNMTDLPFCENMPASPLHWLIADKKECITLEITKEGTFVYDNPVGVLTNNPPFPFQMFALNDYLGLSAENPENRFGNINLKAYSRGMGALGLPGDFSSRSRFVKAVFAKLNTARTNSKAEALNAVFHLLASVEQPKGCCKTENGGYEKTLYSGCINADKGIYFYKTYENFGICAVDMHKEDLSSKKLITYPIRKNQKIFWEK